MRLITRITHAFDFRHWMVWSFGVGVPLLLFGTLSLTSQHDLARPNEIVPSVAVSGTQIVALVFVMEACGLCRVPEVQSGIRRIIDSETASATADGHQFTVVGVSLDSDAAKGVEFLESIHQFDEFLSGNNWLNTGALRYFWTDFPGPAKVPQVVVVERDLVVDSAGTFYSVAGERVIRRIIGASAIKSAALDHEDAVYKN